MNEAKVLGFLAGQSVLWRSAWRLPACAFLASLMAVTTASAAPADLPNTTFTADALQTDLFTGAATAQIPIAVPSGTAGTAPQIVLRYNSGTVDELGPLDQGQGTGLGWTLDIGGLSLPG